METLVQKESNIFDLLSLIINRYIQYMYLCIHIQFHCVSFRLHIIYIRARGAIAHTAVLFVLFNPISRMHNIVILQIIQSIHVGVHITHSANIFGGAAS